MNTIVYPTHNDPLDNKNRKVPETIIKPSTLGPEIGMGIFAGEDIDEAQHLGWYYGDVYTEHPENKSHYMLQVERKPWWVMDDIWESRTKGVGLFIDGAPPPATNKKTLSLDHLYRFSRLNHDDCEPNVKFLQNGRVVALRFIEEGEELFLDYGPHFFSEDE
jgi:hypothetical protein